MNPVFTEVIEDAAIASDVKIISVEESIASEENEESEQLIEREYGSHVRRYSTKPSQRRIAEEEAEVQMDKPQKKVTTRKQLFQATPEQEVYYFPKPSEMAQNESQNEMESQPPSGMQQNKTQEMMYNCAARPVLKDGYDVWLMGDLLLWQAVEENLTYSSSSNPTSVSSNSDFHTVDFRWDWGCRIGLGYNTPYDGWDVDLYWTHMHNAARSHQSAGATKTVSQIWATAGTLIPGTITEVKGHWHVDLDQVDLHLGREFYVSKNLTIRPFGGLRSDWIFQKYAIDTTSTLATQEAKLKDRFWGFGFVAGMNTDWMLGCGFSFYGNADLSLILGFFDIDQKGTQDDVKIWSQDKSFRTGRTIIDLGLGFKWAHLFCQDRFGVIFKVGYEYHLYFNQNQFMLSNGDAGFELFNPVRGDLTYQGVIGSVQIDF